MINRGLGELNGLFNSFLKAIQATIIWFTFTPTGLAKGLLTLDGSIISAFPSGRALL